MVAVVAFLFRFFFFVFLFIYFFLFYFFSLFIQVFSLFAIIPKCFCYYSYQDVTDSKFPCTNTRFTRVLNQLKIYSELLQFVKISSFSVEIVGDFLIIFFFNLKNPKKNYKLFFRIFFYSKYPGGND